MIQLPQKKYNIIYADPPWSYSDKGCNGNADEHYQTMTITDICKMQFLSAISDTGILQISVIVIVW